MKRKIYFGSNLKMYKTVAQTESYLKELADSTRELRAQNPDMELFILPSYTSLEAAVRGTDQSEIRLGAQNMCWEDEGQFTGEISPVMLEELDLHLVMAGHSERRHVFGESDIEENKKMLAAMKHGFTGLLCIGETREEKEYGIADEALRTQIKVGLHGIKADDLDKVWIAYEPVWAIGVNGTPAPVSYAQEKHHVIRQTLKELYGEAADQVPTLYGGSVNLENATQFFAQPDIDGLYVGRVAWDAKRFARLITDCLARGKKQ
jgi:L-erythrulose 1-phosphate isomerase